MKDIHPGRSQGSSSAGIVVRVRGRTHFWGWGEAPQLGAPGVEAAPEGAGQRLELACNGRVVGLLIR